MANAIAFFVVAFAALWAAFYLGKRTGEARERRRAADLHSASYAVAKRKESITTQRLITQAIQRLPCSISTKPSSMFGGDELRVTDKQARNTVVLSFDRRGELRMLEGFVDVKA